MDARAIGAVLQQEPRERSYLLAQVLQQLNQPQPNPQSYGELAARLGAQLVNANTVKQQAAAQQQQQQGQSQALAQALQQAQGGMETLPGTGVQLGDVNSPVGGSPADPNGGALSAIMSGDPRGAAIAEMLMGQRGGEGFSLSPGQTRFGPDGRPIANLPAAPDSGKRGIVTLAKGGQVKSVYDDAPEIGAMLNDGWVERSSPLVQIGDSGPQFPAPPQGFYRPDQKAPGLAPEPGSPPPPERQMSGETKAKMGLLNASEQSLNEAESILFKDGKFRSGLVSQLYNPLRSGAAADLYNSMYEAMSNRLRAESGATITADEISNQVQRFLPKPFVDDEKTAKNKFLRFRAFINQYKSAIQYQPEEEQTSAPKSGNVLRFDKNGNPL